MSRFFCFLWMLLGSCTLINAQENHWLTPWEIDDNTSATYEEVISYYSLLANHRSYVNIVEAGSTDIGLPLHTVIVDKDGLTEPATIRSKGRVILLVNNGIHPGEPCGIDASMQIVRDVAKTRTLRAALEHVSIVIIPIYNVGGALNRGSFSRANQQGPREYGFRGNAKNLDLNRDFIKNDSKNSKSFVKLFQYWQPDMFVDTHTTNGADYQYPMTLIATHPDKLGPSQKQYLINKLEPALYNAMEGRHMPMSPYVNSIGKTPLGGIAGFLDSGRYSTGYTAMHNTIGFVTEAHMLKPFATRVKATYIFLEELIQIMSEQRNDIIRTKREAYVHYHTLVNIPVLWSINKDRSRKLSFKGYTSTIEKSKVTGFDRIHYDTNKPYEQEIDFYYSLDTLVSVAKPKYYIIPQAYSKVIEALQANGVDMQRLEKDTVLRVELYRIEDFKTVNNPFESHYLHYDVKVSNDIRLQSYRKGDIVISTDQPAVRYIVETLEPQAHDSFFNWNYFDGILQQKEHFSAYVFEETAHSFLKENPNIEQQFRNKIKQDSSFAQSDWSQLYWIYKQTPYYEPTHRIYPVGRSNDDMLK